MKINKKALFFDIDGTLFSEKLRQVPQSAVLALKKTMEKGNLTFINTGRTWCQTSKIREEAPVNGLLCGCGTYISVDGKTLYDQRISPERAEKLKEDILRFRMDTVMEGVDACFFRPDGVQTETMRAIRSISTRAARFRRRTGRIRPFRSVNFAWRSEQTVIRRDFLRHFGILR